MMKKLTPIIAIYLLLTGSVIAQNFNINFQAFGETNNIDSVFVKNLSSETELRLAGSDILHLLPASSLRRVSEEFAMAGVYPNPTEFECDIDFIITKPAFTIIEITDVGGKILVQHKEFLNDAYYRFTLSGIGSGVYVLNIRSDSFIYQTKIVGTGRSNQPCLRKTIVAENTQQQTTGATAHYSGKSTIDMLYAFGDILFFEAISDDGHRTIATLKLTADDETVTDHTVYFGFYSCVDAELYMYSIVKIGGHFWMAEDLNTPWFSDTSTIENIPDSTAWAASSQAACCNYGNNASLQTLYNWYAATDGRKICPDGWHLPADFEWQRLEAYIGMSVDEQGANGWRGDGTAALLKESGTQNWLSQSGTDINLSGFSARPAGMRNFAGLYLYSEKNAIWWTATENRDNTAWCRALQFDSNAVYRKDGLKNMGLAVRCIKNYPPEVITGPVNETTDTSVVVSVKLLNNGGAEVTEKGVVWSQNPVPLAEANEGAVLYDGDDEIFELLLPGLTAGSEYYYRAYAVNEVGVGYGSIETFSTSGALVTPPVVVTIEVIDITHNSAGSGGNVISDGGAPVTARGVVWAPFSNPSLDFNQGYTTDGSGTGEFFSTITGLGQSTSFYVCAYATNSAGTTYGNVIEFTTLSAGFVCGETYVDSRDGNEYSTVQIGNQCWLAENLKYLPSVVAPTSSSSVTEYYYVYGYYGTIVSEARLTSNYSDFGVLYNWPAAMAGQSSSADNPSGIQGVCPDGWHLPSDAEWKEMELHFGMLQVDADATGFRGVNEGSKLAGGNSFWTDGLLDQDEDFGLSNFNALPAGYRDIGGNDFFDINNVGIWWTTTEESATYVYDRRLSFNDTRISRFSFNYGKALGFSVRCIKNEESQANLPTISTSAVSDISQTTAICGGNISDDGGSPIIARGVVWSTSPAPNLTNYEGFTEDGASAGEFVSEMSGLNPASSYYVRAYATNSSGTAYGGENEFFTIDFQQCSVEASASQETVCDHNSIILDCISNGVAPFEYSWSGPDGFSSNEQSPNLNNVKFYQSGHYVVMVTDNNACVTKDSVLITIMESIHQISYPDVACDGLNEFYSVEFEVTNVLGTPMQFIANGLLQNEIYSTSIGSANTFSAVVSDINGCSEYSLDYFHDCDCMTFAGTFTGIETLVLQIAECVPSELHNSDQILDGDDIFEFFVHDGSLIPLYYSNTLNICFGDIAGAMLNVEYYIVGVAGNDAMGHVDVNDPCMHVTFSIPVVWIE